MLLSQASVAEQNAAFDVGHAKIAMLISLWVPFMFQSQATARLESPEGRKLLLDTVDDMLAAAERVRNG
jgi:hypothetical protein